MKKYDFVRVVEVEEDPMKEFIGSEGMVIGIDDSWEYPVEVCLFNKELQRKIIDEGILYFKKNELEVIE